MQRAAAGQPSPSSSIMEPNVASQMRAGVRQHGLEAPAPVRRANCEMTLSTSRSRSAAPAIADRRCAAQFVEQSSVLDGDHGLSGEVRHQCDLLVGERPDLLTVDDEGAHKTAVVAHGHGEQRARPAKSGCDPGERLRQLVGGVNEVAGVEQAAKRSCQAAPCSVRASRGHPSARPERRAWQPAGMLCRRKARAPRTLLRRAGSRSPASLETPGYEVAGRA